MRTKPAGAVASGETNERPSSETSWKKMIVSSANSTAAHAVVSVKPRGCFAGSARRLMVAPRASRGGETPFDLGHHAGAEDIPVVRPRERAPALGIGRGIEHAREGTLPLALVRREQQV